MAEQPGQRGSASRRRSLILNLVSNNYIGSQREIVDRLRKYGIHVDQSTVSRDCDHLGLVKKGAFYTRGDRYESERKKEILASLVRNGDIQLHVLADDALLIKTWPGFESAVGSMVNELFEADVAGAVPGQECVLILCGSKSAEALMNHIQGLASWAKRNT